MCSNDMNISIDRKYIDHILLPARPHGFIASQLEFVKSHNHLTIHNNLQNILICDLTKIICEYYNDIITVYYNICYYKKEIQIMCQSDNPVFKYQVCKNDGWWKYFNYNNNTIVNKSISAYIDIINIDDYEFFEYMKYRNHNDYSETFHRNILGVSTIGKITRTIPNRNDFDVVSKIIKQITKIIDQK